jgi:2-polyprenyl-3-methyl-5-hydroxy-6-metoxy-1,4-benzoquinol methylase
MNTKLKNFFVFAFEKLLFLSTYINNLFSTYIENITQHANDPASDFVERFYYKIIIFFYWAIANIKSKILKLIKNIIFQCKLKKIKIYESTFGNTDFRLSTPKLFYSVMKDIANNSNILDFGCGSGACYKNNDIINLIVKSNQKITGIDTNEFAIENFRTNVSRSLLASRMNLKCGNIFTQNFDEKFDCVIFSESAPLLSSDFLVEIVSYIKYNLLKTNGKIIFINNLVENPQFIINFMKPKIKYITTLDFGRVMTVGEFKKLATVNEIKISFEILDSMTIEEIASHYNIAFLYWFFGKLGLKNYLVTQYKITMD